MQAEGDPTRASRQNAIKAWLSSLNCARCIPLFIENSIDDFFTLPFLRPDVLEIMNVNERDSKLIMEDVLRMRTLSSTAFVGLWLQFSGFGKYSAQFQKVGVTIASLRYLTEDILRDMLLVAEEDREALFAQIEYFHYFSSAEAAFWWLRTHGFVKYSFVFARNNIPFYALPLVNFFVVDLMSATYNVMTKKDKQLFVALQALRSSPCYQVKAIAYWLRDLCLEGYSLQFAHQQFLSFDQLMRLTTDAIDNFVPVQADREKLKLAMAEIKENELFYVAVDAVLAHIGMEKYAPTFASHSISIDVLHLLTDGYLVEMGVEDAEDRKKILDGIRHLNNDLLKVVRQKSREDDRPLDQLLAFIGSDSVPQSRNATRAKQRKARLKKQGGGEEAAPAPLPPAAVATVAPLPPDALSSMAAMQRMGGGLMGGLSPVDMGQMGGGGTGLGGWNMCGIGPAVLWEQHLGPVPSLARFLSTSKAAVEDLQQHFAGQLQQQRQQQQQQQLQYNAYYSQPPPSNAIAEALVYDLRSGTGSLFVEHLKSGAALSGRAATSTHPLFASLQKKLQSKDAAGPALSSPQPSPQQQHTSGSETRKKKKKKRTKKAGQATTSETADTTTPYDSGGYIVQEKTSPRVLTVQMLAEMDARARLREPQPVPAVPLREVAQPPAPDSGEETDTSSSGLDDDAFDDSFFDDGITAEMRAQLDAEVAQFERTLYYHSASNSPRQQPRTVPLPHFAALNLGKKS